MSNETFKPGDWYCAACQNHNFARRTHCHRCGADRAANETNPPPQVGGSGGRSRADDWGQQWAGDAGGWGGWGGAGAGGAAAGPCASAGGSAARPNRVRRQPGDWDCALCSNLNFARRTNCHRCLAPRTERPAEAYGAGYGYGGGAYDAGVPEDDGYAQRNPDDWDCWICGAMNQWQSQSCHQCQNAKDKCLPKMGADSARPGDWFCMRCQAVSSARVQECVNCRADRRSYSNELVLDRIRGSQC
eukprot:TRINITY_DN9395_c0_g1_i1.p1 TRINITY_DN9395_c0_g1~~TRINITY_DN9395_c0_g1_i1.p1  ORF type:complete len:245 (+),score=39.87 TRINITY_DN9395_c0_g1_i1:114-848(+)